MSNEEERFLKRLRETFKIEADEHLKAMSSLLLELEKSGNDAHEPDLVETLFREAHSLKGAARSVNLGEIEMVCQALETVLAAMKRQEHARTAAFFDVLFRAIDMLGEMVLVGEDGSFTAGAVDLLDAIRGLGQGGLDQEQDAQAVSAESLIFRPPEVGAEAYRIEAAMFEQETGQDGGPIPQAATPMQPAEVPAAVQRPPVAEADPTVRISTARLGDLLIQAEELLAFKFSAGHLISELHTLNGELAVWKKSWSKTVRDARTMQRAAQRNGGSIGNGSSMPREKTPLVMNSLLEAVERDEFFARTVGDRLLQIERLAEQERRSLATLVDKLLDDMKTALMLPFDTVLDVLPKLVRDLARDSGKDVELLIDAAAIEVDRRILEQMKDPLIHLIRNAIDHGIERPEERVRKNKPPRGRIAVEIVAREGGKVELVIEDDGSGIDAARVGSAARKLDLIEADAAEAFTQLDALALVFESGLSTSPILTDLSGRGLGLAIVREKVEKLGGSVKAEAVPAGGTRFCIVLPTTLATFRGLLVRLGERCFVIPSRNVERVARVPRSVIKTVENRETIELGNQVLALVHLADALELGRSPAQDGDGNHVVVAVLAGGGKQVAFCVDEVLGDQEVLRKGLGPQLPRVRNVAGATVLGAGRVVPILNVADLLKSAYRTVPTLATASTPDSPVRKSILIAEDSITSRSLLKNIIESAGYEVVATVDGADAFTTLRAGRFDLVVSDVEMPRMDGFDLTAKIRADKKLAELPVILVTALDTREHKERGIDAGANAYIVKSSFDQSNLLDAIRRLL